MDWQVVAAVLVSAAAVVGYYLIGDGAPPARTVIETIEPDPPQVIVPPKPIDPERLARFQQALREQQDQRRPIL